MDPKPIDGRKARAQRTRAAILNALLDLIEEGTPLPTAVEVAARAGVALRSIRQHFESRESLFLAASQRHADRVAELEIWEPLAESAPLAERVARFVAARSRTLEATSALRQSAALREGTSAALATALRKPARERRRELEKLFGQDLGALDAKDRADVLDAADLATSGKTWDALRKDLGRSREAAERVMAVTLCRLFG